MVKYRNLLFAALVLALLFSIPNSVSAVEPMAFESETVTEFTEEPDDLSIEMPAYTEGDLLHIQCTILSNPSRANYVNTAMKYHILSETDDYRVSRNLKSGRSVIFFFDGCSDNVDDPVYGNYYNYHLSTYCAVVQEVEGVLQIVFESENCSTMADNPRDPSLNDGLAVPIVLDGVYNVYSVNHRGRYAALQIVESKSRVPVLRCSETSNYTSTSDSINIHARSNFDGTPESGVSPTSYSSTGCFNVGTTFWGWEEYNAFANAIFGIPDAIKTTPYADGSWTKCKVGIKEGLVIVDRANYKTQLAGLYGGDTTNTAQEVVDKITRYTDSLDLPDVPRTNPPIGTVEDVAPGDRSLRICGWALDGDAYDRPVQIHVYVGGTFVGAGLADIAREDVCALYPGAGTRHGFDFSCSIPEGITGWQQVTVFAIDEEVPVNIRLAQLPVEIPVNTLYITPEKTAVNLTLGAAESDTVPITAGGIYTAGSGKYHIQAEVTGEKMVSLSFGQREGNTSYLTISAVRPGSTTVKVGLADSETGLYITDCLIHVTVEDNGYFITYDANGGKGAPQSHRKPQGQDCCISEEIPDRYGYIFLGWAISPDALQPQYQPGDSYSQDANLSLWAVWKEDLDRPVVDMFRMYDPNSGEHFYTGSEKERDNLVDAGWNYEGIGFTFPLTTGKPVHRLYDGISGEHLYTMDESEMHQLLAQGWNYEGVAFNSGYDYEVPQYRLHNPNAVRGAYHFTASIEERDYLISLGWEYQGIGWYSCGSLS